MKFTVKPNTVGRIFPLDMLRYDACYPASMEDVEKLMFSMSSERELVECVKSITLRSFQKPTDGRWKSFGWTITSKEM